jgi:alkaline phosphatase D
MVMRVLFVCSFLILRSTLAEVHHAQGEMAGEVTATSALLQSRITAIPGPELDASGDVPGAEGVGRFEWSTEADFSHASKSDWMRASAERDFILRTKVTDLKPGTLYHYRLMVGQSDQTAKAGPTRSFRTLGMSRTLTFCMGSCMNYYAFNQGVTKREGIATATDTDRQLGFPAFAAMASLKPDFFIGTGDIVYYDHPPKPAAQTLPELRKKWHEQFRYPRLVEFFSHVPVYWSKDDHDFRFNDADLRGKTLPLPATGIEVFREQLPTFETGDMVSPSYRTHRVHQHLQLWFLEGRDHRSPNKMPDGPLKSIWGQVQRQWLQDTLKQSDAKWKVLITPTPMVGPDRNSKVDNHTNLAGFKHEADAFFAWLRANDLNEVLTFCGDRHWQYHSIHPLGVEEFSVGALNDENAIAGERPGGEGTTDPEGKIKQPYIYEEPTGGFLRVTIDDGGQLTLQHYDDEGTVLNTVVKS